MTAAILDRVNTLRRDLRALRHDVEKVTLTAAAVVAAPRLMEELGLPAEPASDGEQAPDEAQMLELGTVPTWRDFEVEGPCTVTLSGYLRAGPGEAANRALVRIRVEDAAGANLDLADAGLGHSQAVGFYRYLPTDRGAGPFSIRFKVSKAASKARFGFQTWGAAGRVEIGSEMTMELGEYGEGGAETTRAAEGAGELWAPTLDEFRPVLERFFDDVAASGADTFVFMFSGTTFIQDIRANRPIRLTRCMKELGIPVLFNFHRWKGDEPFPCYRDDGVLQIPIDYTQELAAEIAARRGLAARQILVVSYPHPAMVKILNRFNANGWVTLYDCRDDWEAFHAVGKAKWFAMAAEKYVVRNCDVVTCVSRSLVVKMEAYDADKEVRLLGNAYDPAFLSAGYRHVPEREPVRVGYFGHLTDAWFHWDALIRIAKARPQYQFEIIGHFAPGDMEIPPNLCLLGAKNHAEINEIAARWSAGLICFKPGQLSDGVDPIKIYEYLALGLPTVSFSMPQIDDYPYTWTASHPATFAAMLDRAIHVRPDMDRVWAWLGQNTWMDRARGMVALCDDPAFGRRAEKGLV